MVVPTCKPAFRLFLSRPGGLVGWVEPDETHHFFRMGEGSLANYLRNFLAAAAISLPSIWPAAGARC